MKSERSPADEFSRSHLLMMGLSYGRMALAEELAGRSVEGRRYMILAQQWLTEYGWADSSEQYIRAYLMACETTPPRFPKEVSPGSAVR